MRPARSRTLRCFDTAGRLMSNGAASSVTAASPAARRARIARRVGSARAAKVWLSWSSYRSSFAVRGREMTVHDLVGRPRAAATGTLQTSEESKYTRREESRLARLKDV